MKYLLLSTAKLLSLAALLILVLDQSQAQTCGLCYENGGLAALLDYSDSSFMTIHSSRGMVHSLAYRFVWSRFSEQGDSVIFHSSPFVDLPEYSLWEAEITSVHEQIQKNGACFFRSQDSAFLKDTTSFFFVRFSTATFLDGFARLECESAQIPLNGVELKFEKGKTITVLRNDERPHKDFTRVGCCYGFKISKKMLTKKGRKLKAIRLVDVHSDFALPWYELETSEPAFISLLYLKVERKLPPEIVWPGAEHFYVMDGQRTKRVDDSTWILKGYPVKKCPIVGDSVFFLNKNIQRFKCRSNDPAFDFKVLEHLPKGEVVSLAQQYSPHLEPEQPAQARPKPKRRTRQPRSR